MNALKVLKINQFKSKINFKILFTFFTSLIIPILMFITIKLAANSMDTNSFGVYNVSRKALSLLSFPLLLGLGISIPRYLSIHEKSPSISHSLVLTGYFMMCIILISFSFVIILFKAQIAFLIFSDTAYKPLVYPITLSIIGFCIYTLNYSYYRGRLMLNTANVIQILNAGIIPLISILIFNKSLSHILYSMGILWIISSAPHSIIILNKSIQITKKKYVFIKSIKTLFSYGFPRVIGEFAMFGFFSIPVIYSAHKVNLEYSGFLSLSFSFFQLFATSYSFIGILMLPTVSRNLLDDKFLTIKKRIDLILLISIFINVLYIIFSFLFLEKIILLFFGSEYLESNMITLKLLYGLIPYIVFFLLRDVLDAISEFPSNSINLSLSLFVMIGLLFLDIFSVENTMLICFCLLGLLSLYSYRRHVKIILLKNKTI